MSTHTNPNDPRVIRSRQLLQKALLELLRESPFQFISVSDLTKRAKLNRATFYLHYLDKFDLLAKTARDTFIAAINEHIPDWQHFKVEDIRQLMVATCNYLEAFLKQCSPANKPYEPLIHAEMQSVLYDYIYCWLSDLLNHPSKTLPIEGCATVISASVLSASLKWVVGGMGQTANQVADQVYDLLISGLSGVISKSGS